MEVINTLDVMKYIKHSYKSGEMRLLIAKHEISLYYSKCGRTIYGQKDGIDIENCNYTVVHRMLDELTENERYKIKLLNPQSSEWKKICIDDEELIRMINSITADFVFETHLLGYTYLNEALFDISRKHMDGKVVDVERSLKAIAKSRGIQVTSLKNTIGSTIRHYDMYVSRLAPEIKKYFIDKWCSSRMFLRDLSHYFLDCIIEKDRIRK